MNKLYLETPFFIPGIKVCTDFFNRTSIPGKVQKVTVSLVLKDHGTNSHNLKKCLFSLILVPDAKEKYRVLLGNV